MSIPPLHAVAVHLPVTLIPLSVAADWIATLRKAPADLRRLGLWFLFTGWISTGAAIAFGYIDLARVMRNPDTHAHYSYLLLHAKLAWVALPLITALLFWRWQIALNRAGRLRLYLAAATAVTGLTLFEAWYGGELVYTVGIGVGPAQSVTDAAEARRSFDAVHDWVTHVPGMSTHPLPDLETPAAPTAPVPPSSQKK